VHPVVELLEEFLVLLLAGFGREAERVKAFDAHFLDFVLGLQDFHNLGNEIVERHRLPIVGLPSPINVVCT
jgi:hypothetical protein